MPIIPFETDATACGLVECRGLMRTEGDALVFEFQTQDGILGVVKSGVKEVVLPFEEVGSVAVYSRWLGLSARFDLQMRSMRACAEVPGMSQGKLQFYVSRRNREAAAEIADIVQSYLMKRGLA